jgi:hypothetical protein
MRIIPNLEYTVKDKEVNDKIERAYKYLLNQLHINGKIETMDMVIYGIYPFYSEQKTKVLFLGREARGLQGSNYIEIVFNGYQNKKIGKNSLDRSSFHRRMLKVAYALNNSINSYKDIPTASKISKQFGRENGLSFAFLNYSKISNECIKKWNTNWEKLQETGLIGNFNSELISAINPDVIISMGLIDQLKKEFKIEKIEYYRNNSLYKLYINNKSYDLINGYHYSAVKGIRDWDNIIFPIMEYKRGKNSFLTTAST